MVQTASLGWFVSFRNRHREKKLLVSALDVLWLSSLLLYSLVLSASLLSGQVAEPDCRACSPDGVDSLPLIECGVPADGVLAADDCRTQLGSPADAFRLVMEESALVRIFLRSDAFDPFLTVYDDECRFVALNVDCLPGRPNACLEVDLGPGTWTLGCSSVDPGARGAYTLEVLCEPSIGPCDGCSAPALDCTAGTILNWILRADCTNLDGEPIARHPLEHPGGLLTLQLLRGPLAPFLRLRDADCELLREARACRSDGVEVCLERLDLDAGTYFVEVGSPSTEFVWPYSLVASCVPPDLCAGCLRGSLDCAGMTRDVLGPDACRDNRDRPVHVFEFELPTRSHLEVGVESAVFEVELSLLGPNCRVIQTADCTAGECLDLRALSAGPHWLQVAATNEGAGGEYTLSTICQPYSPCRDCEVALLPQEGRVEGLLFEGECVLDLNELREPVPIDLWQLDVDIDETIRVEARSAGVSTELFVFDADCEMLGRSTFCDLGTLAAGCAVIAPGEVLIADTTQPRLYAYDPLGVRLRTVDTASRFGGLAGSRASRRLFGVPIRQATAQIVEIDPVSGDILRRLPAPSGAGSGTEGLAFDGESLWYIHSDTIESGSLYRLDPRAGEVLEQFEVSAGSGIYDGLAAGDGRVWVQDPSAQGIHVVDVATGAVTSSLLARFIAGFVLGGLAYDAERDLLWSTLGVDQGTDVVAFSPDTLRQVSRFPVGAVFDGSPCIVGDFPPGRYHVALAPAFDERPPAPQAYTIDVERTASFACQRCELGAHLCGDFLEAEYPRDPCDVLGHEGLDWYTFDLGGEVVIECTSADFAPRLVLFDGDCALIEEVRAPLASGVARTVVSVPPGS